MHQFLKDCAARLRSPQEEHNWLCEPFLVELRSYHKGIIRGQAIVLSIVSPGKGWPFGILGEENYSKHMDQALRMLANQILQNRIIEEQ